MESIVKDTIERTFVEHLKQQELKHYSDPGEDKNVVITTAELQKTIKKTKSIKDMRLLMNPYTRKFYVPEGEIDQVLESDHDRKILYNSFCGLSSGTDFIHDLGESVKTYKDQTDSYWYDLEAKGKKYMVISMGSGDMVRPAGNRDVKYTYADIKEKFLILDGIDYMSNNVCTQIVYMEV